MTLQIRAWVEKNSDRGYFLFALQSVLKIRKFHPDHLAFQLLWKKREDVFVLGGISRSLLAELSCSQPWKQCCRTGSSGAPVLPALGF